MKAGEDSPGRAAVRKRLEKWSAVLAGRKPASTLRNRDLKALNKLIRDADYDALRAQCRLRELSPFAIFPSLDQVCAPLSVINEESGHPNHAEMAYVAAIARLRQARRIFEFGTFVGRTTLHFARMNPEAEVWTLDLPREDNPWRFADAVGTYFAGKPEEERIRFLRGNARKFDVAPFRGTMDFIWVDGDHSYRGVKSDTKRALQLLAPGGAILWHDFSPDSLELVRFFSEFTQKTPLFHLRRTSVLVHLDGVDPLTFTSHDIPFGKDTFRAPR